MPEEQRIRSALERSLRPWHWWSEFRLNLSLARMCRESLTTRYKWELRSLSTDTPASWRTFGRAQVGGAFPIPLWAFTTLTIDDRKVIVGGAILCSANAWINPIRWAVWREIPDLQMPHGSLDVLLHQLYNVQAFVPLRSTEEFRRHVLGTV